MNAYTHELTFHGNLLNPSIFNSMHVHKYLTLWECMHLCQYETERERQRQRQRDRYRQTDTETDRHKERKCISVCILQMKKTNKNMGQCKLHWCTQVISFAWPKISQSSCNSQLSYASSSPQTLQDPSNRQQASNSYQSPRHRNNNLHTQESQAAKTTYPCD